MTGAVAAGSSRVLRGLAARPAVVVGLVILTILIVAALAAPWVMPHSPTRLSIVNRLKPPGPVYWLGTDEFGRDVFSRTILAGRVSLLVGASVVLVSTVAGVFLGLLAGFSRRLDPAIARLIDAMMAFPDILLAIALVAALGPSLTTVIVALGIVYTPRVARIVRASTLVIRELPYVEAARALGVSTARILTRHVLRNLVSPIMVQASFVFAYAMLAEAGLSFLGVGVNPEIPTWGTMIAAGRQFAGHADWIMVVPGVAIVACVLSLQMVGDGIRDLLDPRLRNEV